MFRKHKNLVKQRGSEVQHKEKLHIISMQAVPFHDRTEAGKLLGLELKKFYKHCDVVIGIPRGGVVIGKEIADILKCDLDVSFAHKLGAPNNPEFAIGSIGEDGEVFLNEDVARELVISPDYIPDEKEHQLAEIKTRSVMYREIHPKTSLKGKQVILTDDGVATGSTIQAALWNIRQEKPKKVIVALPVGPEETLKKLAEDADKVICLRVPIFFNAISQFYSYFNQVEDHEVLDILRHPIRSKEKK